MSWIARRSPIIRVLRRSRARAYLRLQRFGDACRECVTILLDDPLDKEALYIKGRALYGLANFRLCMTVFEELIELKPDHVAAIHLLRETGKRLDEQDRGDYDFEAVFRAIKNGERRPDLASFTKLTEIKDAGERGRGLFAKADIKVGGLVLCEKAFISALMDGRNEELDFCVLDLVGGFASATAAPSMLAQCIHKARAEPKIARELLDLDDIGYPTPGYPVGDEKRVVDGQPVLDSFRIHRIAENALCQYNETMGKTEDSGRGHAMWLRASYMNHSCIPNTKACFAGDLVIYRAIHDIAAGEEITTSYIATMGDVRDRRDALLKEWSFHCECPLCVLEANTRIDVLDKRLEWTKNWTLTHEEWGAEIANWRPDRRASDEASSGWALAPPAMRRLERLVARLEKTYDEKEYEDQPRLLAAFWSAQLVAHMPLGILPHQELRLVLATMRNFGYFIEIEGDGYTMVRSRSFIPSNGPAFLVQCCLRAWNALLSDGKAVLAMKFYQLAVHFFGLFCADSNRFYDIYDMYFRRRPLPGGILT